MTTNKRLIKVTKNIALIAHDHAKESLIEWVSFNKEILQLHHLFGTGTTSALIAEQTGLTITPFQSGPYGGDLQIGAKIAEGDIDMMIFFWDPMTSQPHDPDVKALLRISSVWNIPVASNRASADFIISSPLMNQLYEPKLMDYRKQLGR